MKYHSAALAIWLLLADAVCSPLQAQVGAIEIVCHRGANEYAPENTYAAAQLCIEWGVEYVEIDVRTSKDGAFYILHDATVDRTTSGKGRLRDLTNDEIESLDAGGWFDPKFADQRVPRLEPYLRWIKGKAKVYFDVKDADLKKLIDLVYAVGLQDDCFFWFGNPLHVVEFRRLDQKLPLKINVRNAADVKNAVERFKANIVEVGLDNMSDELVAACRERGVKIMIYHPQKDAEGFRRVVQWKPDMVNLNHADLFQRVMRESSK